MGQAETSSSSVWVRGVVELFGAHGVAPGALFDAAGLDLARLKDPHARFTSGEVSRLWRLAVEWTGEPALGLDRQLAARFINFDIAAQSMWPSPNLQAGLEGLSRYLGLIGDAAGFSLEPGTRGAWLVLGPGNAPGLPRQRVEFGMLSLLKLCRKVTHKPLKPLEAEFNNPEPADYHPYRMAFACPLRFGGAANRLLLADDALQLPLAAASSVFASQERVNERRLARVGHLRTTYRAGEELVRQLHLGVPGRARIARALELSEAALEQRLKAERTSFEQLLDEVRQELAREYLGDPGYLLARLPALLGYTSAAEFAAACKRWFSLSPAQARRLLQTRTTTS